MSSALLTDAILLAGLAASDDLTSWLAREGLTDVRATDWPILRLIAPGASALKDLVVPLGISQQAVGKSVASLVERGYVQRERSDEDRRVKRVTLTARGRALLAAADAWALDQQARAVQRWGEPEVLRTTAILTRFAERGARVPSQGRNLRPAGGR